MLIALLSDSHDNAATLTAALVLLAPRKPAAYLHAGDICSPDMLELMAGYLPGVPGHFVFGNNDFDHDGLHDRAADLGLICHGDVGDLTLGGRRIGLLHGDDSRLRIRLLQDQQHDYLIHGHTHHLADQRLGRTRVINPGALHRARTKTVALLDLAADALEILTVTGPAPY